MKFHLGNSSKENWQGIVHIWKCHFFLEKTHFFQINYFFFEKKTDFCSEVPFLKEWKFLWNMKMLQRKTRLNNHIRTEQMLSTRSQKLQIIERNFQILPSCSPIIEICWDFPSDKCLKTAKMSDKLQDNPLERKTSDTLKRKNGRSTIHSKMERFSVKTDDFSLYLTFLQHKHAICVSWWSNVRPYTHTSIAATVLYFFCLQITIARAYISKSIHVAFRNESSLNIYVHICFLNENCYGKSRAECEKSRSSQPYFPTIQKYLVSSVRQWERIETNRYRKCSF